MKDFKDSSDRKAYEKPAIKRIELVADEVLGTGCKRAPGLPGVGGPVGCGSAACVLTTGS